MTVEHETVMTTLSEHADRLKEELRSTERAMEMLRTELGGGVFGQGEEQARCEWRREHVDPDPLTLDDLFLAADLEHLGCTSLGDSLRTLRTHDEATCLVMGLRELLRAASASPEDLEELLAVVTKADKANLEAWQKDEEERRAAAKMTGAAARTAGLIAPEDIELLERLRAMTGSREAADLAAALEECQTQEDIEVLKRLMLRMGGGDTGAEDQDG